MSLNVKAPAYARTLLNRRRAGWLPWLVLVAVGAVCDWSTLRNRADVARIGLTPHFPLTRGDWRCLRGLDVVLSPVAHTGWTAEHQAERYQLARACIWQSGEPATLWEMEDGLAFQLFPYENAAGWQFDRVGLGLDPASERFVLDLRAVREAALLNEVGFFGRPEFAPDREALVQRLAG